MKTDRMPYVTGDLPPVDAIWVPMTASALERRFVEFKKATTRAWHTPSINIYEQIGCGCYVTYSWKPRAVEMAELKEFIRDYC
jgi:hypothetical protein